MRTARFLCAVGSLLILLSSNSLADPKDQEPSAKLREAFGGANSVTLEVKGDLAKVKVFRSSAEQVLGAAGFRVVAERSKDAQARLRLDTRCRAKIRAFYLGGRVVDITQQSCLLDGKLQAEAPGAESCSKRVKIECAIGPWAEVEESLAKWLTQQAASTGWTAVGVQEIEAGFDKMPEGLAESAFWQAGSLAQMLLELIVSLGGRDRVAPLLQNPEPKLQLAAARVLAPLGDHAAIDLLARREAGSEKRELAGQATTAPPAVPQAEGEEKSERVVPAPEANSNAVVWVTPQPRNPQAGDVWVNPRDGMEMVYVPPSEFIFGTSDAEVQAWLQSHPMDAAWGYKPKWEQPQCSGAVTAYLVDGYWIAKTEVTNKQYLQFVTETKHRAPDHWGGRELPYEGWAMPGVYPSARSEPSANIAEQTTIALPKELENLPVTWVDWNDAQAYAQWAGGRLPNELEWEKAARGTDGRVFPWGSEWNADRVVWRSRAPEPVGTHPGDASPYGCLDMAGNVSEWCADWWDERAYDRLEHYVAKVLRPKDKFPAPSPPRRDYHVIRGSGISGPTLGFAPLAGSFRCACRGVPRPPLMRLRGTGFRYVRKAQGTSTARR